MEALLTRRTGEQQRPVFPKLTYGQVALTWIGHASFLVQFTDLNVLIDPNFANWLFLLKRIKRSGLRLRDLPPIDLVLLTHAHFDHFHKPTLRRLPNPKIGIMPWGVGDLARNLGFGRVVELDWWESFSQRDWTVTLTPSKHWGPGCCGTTTGAMAGSSSNTRAEDFPCRRQRVLRWLQEHWQTLRPEIALFPIGAYHPDSFRHVHMGPDEAIKVFEPQAKGSSRCITALFGFHSRTWMNRPAG